MNKLLEISTGKINSNYNFLLMETEFLIHYIILYSIPLINRITAIRNWKNRIPEICREFHTFQVVNRNEIDFCIQLQLNNNIQIQRKKIQKKVRNEQKQSAPRKRRELTKEKKRKEKKRKEKKIKENKVKPRLPRSLF